MEEMARIIEPRTLPLRASFVLDPDKTHLPLLSGRLLQDHAVVAVQEGLQFPDKVYALPIYNFSCKSASPKVPLS